VNLRRVVAAVCAALAAGTVLTAGPSTAAEGDEASPLTVTLARLTPSTIPSKGRIVLAGSVRNDSDELWSAINVHPVVSATPMTDREQLAAAAASDPAVEIGTRLTEIG